MVKEMRIKIVWTWNKCWLVSENLLAGAVGDVYLEKNFVNKAIDEAGEPPVAFTYVPSSSVHT